MSAINPASFVTPTSSLVPAGYGGQGLSRDPTTGRRGQQRNYGYAHGGQQIYDQRQSQSQRIAPRPQYYAGYNNFSSNSQHAPYELGPYHQTAVDPFAPYMGYPLLNANAPTFAPESPDSRNRGTPQRSNGDWMARFQNMSLG